MKIVFIAVNLFLGSALFACSAPAAIIQFDLLGIGGPGLLPTNERPNPAISAGSGGETGAGIFFDDITKDLTINVAWGSDNGFTDLTGVVNAGHLHGAPGIGLTGAAGVLQGLTLDSTNNGADDGFINQTLTLTAAQESLLLDGDTYLNFHTTANSGGEIRGNLVISPVPEPSSMALVGLIVTVTGISRWSRKRRLTV